MPLGAELTAVVFGLLAALTWGAGDFSGGAATRRSSVLGVVAISQAAGLLLLVALALLTGEPFPSIQSLAWGCAAGVAGGLGVGALYLALASGQMGVAAPITAVLAAAVPVIFASFTQGAPNTAQVTGFAIAMVGVWVLSRPGEAEVSGRQGGVGLALLAGTAIGVFLILLKAAGTDAVFWPLAAARVASLSLLVVVAALRRQGGLPRGRVLPLVLLAGAFDVGGNAFFVLAAQVGRLDVAAVLSSLYPVSTVILARLILKERVTRMQAAGVLAALAAVALIAAG